MDEMGDLDMSMADLENWQKNLRKQQRAARVAAIRNKRPMVQDQNEDPVELPARLDGLHAVQNALSSHDKKHLPFKKLIADQEELNALFTKEGIPIHQDLEEDAEHQQELLNMLGKNKMSQQQPKQPPMSQAQKELEARKQKIIEQKHELQELERQQKQDEFRQQIRVAQQRLGETIEGIQDEEQYYADADRINVDLTLLCDEGEDCLSASFEWSDHDHGHKQEVSEIPSDLDEGYAHTSTDDTFAKASKKKYASKSRRVEGRGQEGKVKSRSAAKPSCKGSILSSSRAPLRQRLLDSCSEHFEKLSNRISNRPVIFCLVFLFSVSAPLIYFDTAAGRKIASLSWSQMFVLLLGLCIAVSNLFVPSRFDRFEAKQRKSRQDKMQEQTKPELTKDNQRPTPVVVDENSEKVKED